MLGVPWYAPWANHWVKQQLNLPDRETQMVMMTMGRPLNRDKGASDWWLLNLEARKMGVNVSQQQVEQYLRDRGITGPDLNKIRDASNMSAKELLSSVAEYIRVCQAGVLASGSVQVTEPEVKDLFVQTNDKLKVDYAILPASKFEKPTGAQPADEKIPEAELETLFKKYRDVAPGVTDTNPYGFGYKIPDREVIQYAGGTVSQIAKTLKDVPEERARRYFEQHKSEFEPQRPATNPPTTQPTVTFEQVKAKVIDRIKQQDAAQMLRRAIDEIRTTTWIEYTGAKQELADGQVPPTLAQAMQKATQQIEHSKQTASDLPAGRPDQPEGSQQAARHRHRWHRRRRASRSISPPPPSTSSRTRVRPRTSRPTMKANRRSSRSRSTNRSSSAASRTNVRPANTSSA